MSSITLDLGNVPSVLRALSDPHNVQLVANAMAERYVTDVHDWIDAGRAFTPREGQLQQSIGWHGNGDGSSTVYANAEYAGYVERGTGEHAGHKPWVIGPNSGRDGLKRPVSGAGYVLSRNRPHKGSRPHPFFFADMDNRVQHLQAAGVSVLARIIANGQ